MVGKVKPSNEQTEKVGFLRVAIFIGIAIIIAVFSFFILIPWLTSEFVVPLFRPSGDKLEKIGFVEFEGLVWASTTKEKAEEIVKRGTVEISKDLINKEYIFDFTFKPRNEREHGYVKKWLQFYVKSEVMGEHAIIIDPELAFSILALDIGFFFAIFITMGLPRSLRFMPSWKGGLMTFLITRQIENVKTKIRLQTGFDVNTVHYLVMPDDELKDEFKKNNSDIIKCFESVWERTGGEQLSSPRKIPFESEFNENVDIVKFREERLYNRIKEYFSDFVYKEIIDTKGAINWLKYLGIVRFFWPFPGLRLYMAHHFTEKYSNNVTGLAYGGAAFLIVAVGIRGLKFIPAAKPSFILLAIFLEFTMLVMLAVTLIYTEEEERMDRMLKKMEDANMSQLEVLRSQQFDIHRLAEILVGQSSEIIKARVEEAISEYLSSADYIKRMVAEEISQKIIIKFREKEFTEEN